MESNPTIHIVAEVLLTGHNGMVHFMNDNHFYFCHHITQSAKYFRCRKYRDGCPGRVTMYSNGLNIPTSSHNHDADAVPELTSQANGRSLLNVAMNFRTSSFENILNDPSRNANHLLKLLLSMKRQEDLIYQDSVQSTDHQTQCQVTLFMTKKAYDLLQIISSVSLLHIPVPQMFQMCVVAGVWGRRAIPLAWIMSEKYTHEALRAGLQMLKSALTIHHYSKVMSAVDVAGLAFSDVFSVEVYSSLYDFIHDIVSKVTGLNENPALAYLVRLCCGLPLLPGDVLQQGINFIIDEAIQFGETTYYEAVPLFQFIEEQWLRVPAKKFTMCGDMERTNYSSENLKSTINSRISVTQNYYSTVRCIVTMSSRNDSIIDQVFSGQNLTPQGPVPLLMQTDVVNLFNDVLKPPFSIETSVKNFLVAVSEKISHLIL